MIGRNTIKFPHVPLDLVPKILDPVYIIFLIDKQNRVIDPVVFEL